MSIFNTFKPIIYKLKDGTANFEKIEFGTDFSNDNLYPKLSYGYNHFVFQNMTKYTDTVHKYEKTIPNIITEPFNIHSIQQKSSKNYISILEDTNKFIKKLDSKIPEIVDNDFMKIWELNLYFSLIPDTNKKFTSVHISDSECQYIKPTIIFRLLNNGNLKKDEFIILSDKKDKDDFVKYFKKNITENKSKEEADFITVEIHNVNNLKELTEQYAFNTIIKSVLDVIELQKNGGNLILKIYDTYTEISLNIIEFLKYFYEEVYISKPFTSLQAYSEKFLVCKNFDKSKVSKNIIKKYKNVIEEIEEHKNFKICKLFDDVDIKDTVLKEFRTINIEMAVYKYNGLYNYMSFIGLDNKNGVEFEEMLNKNTSASEFWTEVFLNKDNFKKIKNSK